MQHWADGVYLQKVSLQPKFLLSGRTQGSDGGAHKLLRVDLSKLLQDAQGGRSILILIQEDLDVRNHTKVSNHDWNTSVTTQHPAVGCTCLKKEEEKARTVWCIYECIFYLCF